MFVMRFIFSSGDSVLSFKMAGSLSKICWNFFIPKPRPKIFVACMSSGKEALCTFSWILPCTFCAIVCWKPGTCIKSVSLIVRIFMTVSKPALISFLVLPAPKPSTSRLLKNKVIFFSFTVGSSALFRSIISTPVLFHS